MEINIRQLIMEARETKSLRDIENESGVSFSATSRIEKGKDFHKPHAVN